MSVSLNATVRAALVAGVALLAAGGTASAAQAASGDLSYTCDVRIGPGAPTEFTTTLTARLDFPVPDDGTYAAPVGSTLVLNPMTGTVLLPEQVVDLLRDQSVAEVVGSGRLHAEITAAPADTITPIDLALPATAVPEQGPLTMPLRNDDPGIATNVRQGENVLVAPRIFITLSPSDNGVAEGVALECTLVEGGDIAIDRLTGTVTPSATASADPSPTATPVRPVVVQTDFAGDDGSSGLPVVVVGAVLAMAGGVLVVRRGRAPSATRRH